MTLSTNISTCYWATACHFQISTGQLGTYEVHTTTSEDGSQTRTQLAANSESNAHLETLVTFSVRWRHRGRFENRNGLPTRRRWRCPLPSGCALLPASVQHPVGSHGSRTEGCSTFLRISLPRETQPVHDNTIRETLLKFGR